MTILRARVRFADALALATMLAIVIACIAAITHAAIVSANQAARLEVVREADGLRRIVAEQILRSVRAVDYTLRFVAHELGRDPTPGRLAELVKAGTFSMDTLVQISDVDAQGLLVQTDKGATTSRIELADREHIKVHIDGQVDGLFVGRPVVGRASGQWSIQFTRSARNPDGTLARIIVASMDPRYFERFWRNAVSQKHYELELVGLDGIVRASSNQLATRLAAGATRPEIASRAADAPRGEFTETPTHGRPGTTHLYETIAGLPLVLSVRFDPAQNDTAIERIRSQYIAIGLIACLALIGFGALLLRRAIALTAERTEAEIARNRLREAIEAIPDGFALFDAEDRLVIFNSAYRDIYSTSREFVREGITFAELLRAGAERGQYPEAIGRVEEWLEQRISAHRNPTAPFEQLTDDGRWLRIEERRTLDGGIVGIRADVTEIKDRELKLTSQTALLSATFEHMSEGLSIADAGGGLLAFNRMFAELLNLPESVDVKDTPITELFAVFGQSTQVVPEAYNSDGEQSFCQSLDAPGAPIEWLAPNDRIIELRSTRLPDGGIVTTYNDVSDRRQSAQLVRASDALKSGIIASSIDAIIITDCRGIINEFNRSAEKIFGWDAAEAIGRTIGEVVVPPEMRRHHEEGLTRFGQTGQSRILGQLLELPAIHKSGRRFPTETTITAITTDGRTRFSAFIRDISERKRIEAETSAAREAAEAANRAKTEFLAMVSHEFRTPMNGIIGLSSLLKTTRLDGEQGQFVRGIEESANRLLVLLNEVLEFTRADTKRLSIEPAPFELKALLESATDTARVLLGAKPVEVTVRIIELDAAWLLGDSNRIYQILHNLLANSAKFIERGIIDVLARPAGLATDGAPLVRFEISDSGPGIPGDVRARIFEPFEQGRPDTASRYGGSGLGLAICRRLVHLMRGDIGFESREGEGTTFWFELPLPKGEARPDDPRVDDALAAMEARIGALRVLVAEDTPTSQLVIGAMLKKLGHDAQIVADGAQAVTAASSGAFDLILLDLQMPMLSGIEACRRIRALPGRAGQVPVLALTAQVLGETIAEVEQAGMDGHLAKPINLDRLRTAIVEAPRLDRRHGAAGDAEPNADTDETGEPIPVVIEAAALDELRSSIGDESFDVLVGAFVTECGQLLASVASQMAARDEVGLRHTAHKLAGLFSQFGCGTATEIAREIEGRSDAVELGKLGDQLIAVGRASVAELESRQARGH